MSPKIALLVYLLLAAAILALFLGTHQALSPIARRGLGRWLDKGRAEDTDWAPLFLDWFDSVFAVRTVSLPGPLKRLGAFHLPSLKRSIFASAMSLILLGVIWVACKDTLSRPLRFGELGQAGILGFQQVGLLGLIYGGATLITNWIPDYLSLIESRYIMARLSRTRSPLARALWLLLDAALTLSIAFGAICVGAWLILPLVSGRISLEVGCFTAASFTIADAWTIFTSGLRFSTPPATLNYDASGIYIYSTFLTSLWIWLYLASGWLLRSLSALRAISIDHERPMPKMSIGALLSLSLTYWPSWALVSEPKVDVHILHGAAEAQRAEAVRAYLEVEGLSTSSGDAHNKNAELVLTLPGAPKEALDEAKREEDCGQRPHRSIQRLHKQEGALPPRIIRWAKRTSSLLSRDQLAECRALMGRPPLPEGCPVR